MSSIPSTTQVTDPIVYASEQLGISSGSFGELVKRCDAELGLSSPDSRKAIEFREKNTTPALTLDEFFNKHRNIQNWKKVCIHFDSESNPREASFRFGDQVFAVAPVPTPKDKGETIKKIEKQAVAYLLRHPIYRFEFLQYEPDPLSSLSRYFKECNFKEDLVKKVKTYDRFFEQKLELVDIPLCSRGFDPQKDPDSKKDPDFINKYMGIRITKALGIRHPSLSLFLKNISIEYLLSKLQIPPIAGIVADYLDGDFLYANKLDALDQLIQTQLKVALLRNQFRCLTGSQPAMQPTEPQPAMQPTDPQIEELLPETPQGRRLRADLLTADERQWWVHRKEKLNEIISTLDQMSISKEYCPMTHDSINSVLPDMKAHMETLDQAIFSPVATFLSSANDGKGAPNSSSPPPPSDSPTPLDHDEFGSNNDPF